VVQIRGLRVNTRSKYQPSDSRGHAIEICTLQGKVKFENWKVWSSKTRRDHSRQISGRHALMECQLWIITIGERVEIWYFRSPESRNDQSLQLKRARGRRYVITGEGEVWELKTPNVESQNKSRPLIWKRSNLIRRFEGADLNRQFRSAVKIVRLTVTSHCGDRKWSNCKSLRVGYNRDHSIEKGTCGDWWWIAGRKEVWFQTTLGCARNHMFTRGSHPRSNQGEDYRIRS